MGVRTGPFLNAAFAMLLMAACGDVGGKVGDPCLTRDECEEGSLCYQADGGEALCMATCELDTRICDGGELCLTGASGDRVCFLGGATLAGESCSASDECEAGHTCVDGGSGATCVEACDTRVGDCGAGRSCVPLEGAAGFCASE